MEEPLTDAEIARKNMVWGWALFGLFWAQFLLTAVLPESLHGTELLLLSGMYLFLGIGVLLRDRGRLPGLLRDGLWTPHDELHR